MVHAMGLGPRPSVNIFYTLMSKLTGQIDKLQRDSGLTLEEFQEVFEDYLIKQDRVPDVLTRTVNDLFEGPVSKRELRKILTEIGSESLEPEEADEVINETSFNGNGHVTQDGWLEFLLYLVYIKLHNKNQQDERELSHDSPEVVTRKQSQNED